MLALMMMRALSLGRLLKCAMYGFNLCVCVVFVAVAVFARKKTQLLAMLVCSIPNALICRRVSQIKLQRHPFVC